MNFIITQIIGGIGYLILSLSYFKKQKREILFMQIISNIMFTIHYYLLNGITGATCNLIALIVYIIIYLFEKYKVKNKNILILGMIPFIIIIAMTSYKDINSIFPIIASVSVVISFLTNDENVIRGIGIIAAICWLIYAFVYKSYVAIAFETITLIFVVIAFVRNNRFKKKQSQ